MYHTSISSFQLCSLVQSIVHQNLHPNAVRIHKLQSLAMITSKYIYFLDMITSKYCY